MHLKFPIAAPYQTDNGELILDKDGNIQLPPGKEAELREAFEFRPSEVLKWHPMLEELDLPSGRKSILPTDGVTLFNIFIRYENLRYGIYQKIDFGSTLQADTRRGRYH